MTRPCQSPLGIKIIYPPTYRATYQAALLLAADIDDHLKTGRRHYRNRRGGLLLALDQVVLAILDNDLEEAEPMMWAEAA